MITGYEAFGIYQALKLHFTTENFDYFKYNGKSKISVTSFENRKDKWFFYKLSRKFVNKKDMTNFIAHNFIEEGDVWSGALLEEKAETNHQLHQKINESLTYTFKNDCKNLFGDSIDPNKYLEVVDGQYPELLKKALQKDISFETLCVLNKILNFFPMWNKKINDTVFWPTFKRKIEKYTPFMEIDVEKYKKILKDIINES